MHTADYSGVSVVASKALTLSPLISCHRSFPPAEVIVLQTLRFQRSYVSNNSRQWYCSMTTNLRVHAMNVYAMHVD